MKLNLLFNSNNLLSDAINCDVFADQDSDKVQINPNNLSNVAAKGEVDELVANCFLEHFEYEEARNILNHLCTRIAFGGQIIIGYLDFDSLIHARVMSDDLEFFNYICYGKLVDGNITRSVLNMRTLCKWLENNGFKIVSKTTSSFRITVVAERVKPND